MIVKLCLIMHESLAIFTFRFCVSDDGIYLAYSDFHQYLVSDSACTKELNQWFAKHLDSVCVPCEFI